MSFLCVTVDGDARLHCRSYGTFAVYLNKSTEEQLRAELAAWWKKRLGHELSDGAFWEMSPEHDAWERLTITDSASKSYRRCVNYFPTDFDPNVHAVVTMLLDPQHEAFGTHVVLLKTKACRDEIAASFRNLMDNDDFVLVSQEDHGVYNDGHCIKPHDVFLACMPKVALKGLCLCEVGGYGGLCLNARVGDMRPAIAKLNNWKLEDVVVQVGMTDCGDEDDIGNLGVCETPIFVRISGGKERFAADRLAAAKKKSDAAQVLAAAKGLAAAKVLAGLSLATDPAELQAALQATKAAADMAKQVLGVARDHAGSCTGAEGALGVVAAAEAAVVSAMNAEAAVQKIAACNSL